MSRDNVLVADYEDSAYYAYPFEGGYVVREREFATNDELSVFTVPAPLVDAIVKARGKQSEVVTKALVDALEYARCPDSSCDGNGTTAAEASGCEAGCCGQPLSNGECCGNAIAVQVQTIEPARCQWCHGRTAALALAKGQP